VSVGLGDGVEVGVCESVGTCVGVGAGISAGVGVSVEGGVSVGANAGVGSRTLAAVFSVATECGVSLTKDISPSDPQAETKRVIKITQTMVSVRYFTRILLSRIKLDYDTSLLYCGLH
jgi:hypothetical protein